MASGTFEPNITNLGSSTQTYMGVERIDKSTGVGMARTVLLGLSKMEFGNNKDNLRISAVAGSSGEYRLSWTIETWAGTKLNDAGVSYLAMRN